MKKSEIREMIREMIEDESILEYSKEEFIKLTEKAHDPGIKLSKNGYVQAIYKPNGKLAKSVKIDGEQYRYNSVYKTYNSVANNNLLYK